MRLENFITKRFIFKTKNKNISASFKVSIAVISLSIIFFIASVSIMNGYLYELVKIFSEVKSFHIVFPPYYSGNEIDLITDFLNKYKEVKYADVYREAKVLLSHKNYKSGVAFFRSVPEDIFIKDDKINNIIKLVDGKKELSENVILISEKVSEKLKADVGDYIYTTVTLVDDKADITFKKLYVGGIFTTGFQELDEQLVFISNKTGDIIFKDKIPYYIFLKLKDYKKVDKFSYKLMSEGYGVTMTWKELNHNYISSLKLERNVIAFIVILVVFVSVINILTAIYISIYEKRKDIGILKAIGFSPKRIINIFLFKGIYVGLIGIAIGVSAGLLISHYLNEILMFFNKIINIIQLFIYYIVSIFFKVEPPQLIQVFSKEFYLDKIYTEISVTEILVISLLALLFSIIASIIPAVSTGKIKPNEVIKDA